ncbi:protein SPT2 protein [Dioscorea alata]|uniref:Protein SPT2 protein n=2 Tax=Dioscorea alata TaxID=55571 RepID=A0ACB7V676_DIOAL|nr:protein SPT2 protein [Dioscorea alata]KAH7668903.1 protein SPT2 protein [Dioscorea alata]
MRDYEREYDREGYGEDEYDDYEEEGGEEEEEEEVERKPTKEEQDFLKLREQLKERFRRNLKKESAKVLGHSSRSQDRRTSANDKFGSFFGPSQPAIAQRVIEKSQSIRETQHNTAKLQSSSSNKKNSTSISSAMKTNQQYQRPKVVNEIKRKAQTLKDMRDYSFLLSDDADMPVPEKDQSAPRMTTDVRLAQASLKNKLPISKPERQSVIRHHSRNSTAANRPMPAKGTAVKEALANRPMLPSSELRKAGQNISGNGPARPAGKIMPSKVPPRAAITNRPQPKVTNGSTLERKPSTKPQSTTQNHFAAHRKVPQVPDKVLTTKKQPEVSLKHQPLKRNPSHGIHEERLKKKPLKRHPYSDDDDEEAINMIRQMFRYDPRKFANDDGDDSDMEVGFDVIQKEERKSAKIARMEDEEQLRLIEEEEKRERMRKKQKLGHHR